MKIEVTQEHIDDAHPNYCECPIALAIKEMLPDSKIKVMPDGFVSLTTDNESFDITMCPSEAKEFITQYDIWATHVSNNHTDPRVVCPEPISFELEI